MAFTPAALRQAKNPLEEKDTIKIYFTQRRWVGEGEPSGRNWSAGAEGEGQKSHSPPFGPLPRPNGTGSPVPEFEVLAGSGVAAGGP